MSLRLDQPAPVFTLHNTLKAEIHLSAQKGKNVVLLFFLLAFTSTCTAELCSVRDELGTYNGLNALVFGISNDSVFALAKFKEEQKLNFDLLSDFNKTVSAAYNSLYSEFILGMKGVSKRSAFVIDKNGLLCYAEILEKAGDLPNFNAIKACLQNLQ
jgi:glutaredoxin-dependent peroxiredoxin